MGTEQQPLRVCYFGTYRAGYSRNVIMLDALRTHGVDVTICHATLWHSIEDRVQVASGGWLSGAFIWRVISTYLRLLNRYRQVGAYDVLVVGYPGQFDVYLARLLAAWRRKPVVLDVLMSLHRVAEERGLTEKSPTSGRIIFGLEKLALRLPHRLIMENRIYQTYLSEKYGIAPARFRFVPLGADERKFFPREGGGEDMPFRVVYFGTFLPSHGLDAIVSAAKMLAEYDDVLFEFFGKGQEMDRIVALTQSLGLENVVFHGFVSKEALLNGIANAHVCLGVLGDTKQAQFTVQNKVWETLAMRKCLISAESDAVREWLEPDVHAKLIARNNAHAIADAILEMKANPEKRLALADAGYEQYRATNSLERIGAKFADVLTELVHD